MHYNINKEFKKASKYLDKDMLQKALKIFKKLYKKGLVDAGLNIGYIYDKLKKNKKAKKWYKKLIKDSQDTSAMINLGILYKEKYNIKKAKKYFLKASKLGDGDASLEMAKIYLCEAEIKKAKKYLLDTIHSKNVCSDSIESAKIYLSKISRNLGDNDNSATPHL